MSEAESFFIFGGQTTKTKNKDTEAALLLKINRSIVIFVVRRKGFLSGTLLVHLVALFYKLLSALKAKYVARLSAPAFG